MTALKFVLVAALVLLAAQVSGWSLLDRIFYTLAGILVLALVLSRLSLHGVRLIRETPTDRGQAGQVFTERLRLENTSRLPKLWVEVQDLSTLPDHQASVVASLGPRSQRQWTISTVLRRRGRYQLGPVRLQSGDPFGLFPVQQRPEDVGNGQWTAVAAPGGNGQRPPATVELLVYPATVPLPNFAFLEGELPGGNTTYVTRPLQVTPNAAGIREYLPGDSFNRIAWPTSARLGRLVVKELELDPVADSWLVLDMERWAHVPADVASDQWAVGSGQLSEGSPDLPLPLGEGRGEGDSLSTQHSALSTDQELWRESTEEFCVTIAASLSQHFLAQKRAVGLIMAGQHYEVLPTDRGPRQMVKVLEALAVVRANGGIPLGEVLTAEAGRFNRYSTLTIVTPSTDEAWVPALTTLIQSGVRASVVIVDASTFGGPTSPLLVVGQLAALHIPTFILRRTDDVGTVLSRSSALPARYRSVWRPPGVA